MGWPPTATAPSTAPSVTAPDEQTARMAARAARKAKKAADSLLSNTPPVPELPAAVAASVTSIEEARSKRGKLEKATAAEIKKRKPVELELAEVDKYKLLHLNDRKLKQLDAVRAPIVEKARLEIERELEAIKRQKIAAINTELEAALASDEEYLKVDAEQVAAVNHVLDVYETQLPPDFAVVTVSPETNMVRGEYSPSARGSRLQTLKERKG